MTKNNLVIIGNGFDLTCKLKSSYKEYFASKFDEKFTRSLNSLKETFKSFYSTSLERKKDHFSVYLNGKVEEPPFTRHNQINIWDLIIFYGMDGLPSTWSDVESRILEFMIYDEENAATKQNIPNFNQMNDSEYTSDKIYDKNGEFSSYFYSQLVIFAAAKFQLSNPANSKEVLLSELKKFEESFSDYLKGLLDDEGWFYFNKNAVELLDSILTQANGKEGLISHNILSFNYTTPFSHDQISNLLLKFQNIHGRLADKNIIFGIDQDKVRVSDISYQFTKTYRQLIKEAQQYNHDVTILPEKENINKIIFFGHSLSEADYSYFQSIFDYYDVYGSNVETIFFYNDYAPSQSNLIQQDQVLSVSKLIKRYGLTMANKDHGENLLHKLIIEKRLSVIKLKVPPMLP